MYLQEVEWGGGWAGFIWLRRRTVDRLL